MKNSVKLLLCGIVVCCVGIVQPTCARKKSTPSQRSPSFVAYLESASIPDEVATLAMSGVKNYKDPNFVLRKARGSALAPQKAGGRLQRPWIQETFGQKEQVLETQLQKLASAQTWTLEELNNAYTDTARHFKQSACPANVTLVKGLSVTYLNELPLGNNSIVQLASQFNYLESPGTHIVPVSAYASDLTQGPQGSIEAAAAALHRTAAVKAGKLEHALVDVLPKNHESYYKNGYLELSKCADVAKLADHIQKNIHKLRILPQWVTCEASGTKQLQVFASAPSFQGFGKPSMNSPEAKICDMLVAPQYEIIGKIAVMHSLAHPHETINLHLTLVGQGVFSNPPEVMANALKKVAAVVTGHPNIHVYIHGYSTVDQALVLSLCTKIGIDCKQMSVAEFASAHAKHVSQHCKDCQS